MRALGFYYSGESLRDELSEYREYLRVSRSVVDQLKAAVVLADMTIPGCPMICVNEAFCAITGYTREEAEGRNCRFLQGPATELESLRVIQRTLANRTDCQVAIHNYRT